MACRISYIKRATFGAYEMRLAVWSMGTTGVALFGVLVIIT
jgi:hypothetical protein